MMLYIYLPKALTFKRFIEDNDYLKEVLESSDRSTIYYIKSGADTRLISDIMKKAGFHFCFKEE